MNMPKHIARKATTRVGSTRSTSAGAMTAAAEGVMVAALAIGPILALDQRAEAL